MKKLTLVDVFLYSQLRANKKVVLEDLPPGIEEKDRGEAQKELDLLNKDGEVYDWININSGRL